MLDFLPPPTLALGGLEIVAAAVSLASAAYTAYRLLTIEEPANRDPEGDNKANEQGTYIGLFAGRFRAKGIHMADLRSTRFSQEDNGMLYRYEQARLLFGMSDITAWTGIFNQDGRQLFEGRITPDTHGAFNSFSFETDHFNTRIFPQFGQRNQIVDGQEPDRRTGSTRFNSQFAGSLRQQDLPSAWNHFAFWGVNPWNLGVQGQVFGEIYAEGISGLAPEVMDFEDGSLKMMSTADGQEGMNAAHVAGLLTVAPFPHGQAAPPDIVSPDGLRAWAQAMRDDEIVTSFEMEGGPTYGDTMDTLLVESNVAAPLNAGILDFIPVRENSVIYTIPASAIVLPEPRRTIYLGDRQISFSNYSFDNNQKQHNKSDIAIRDNSQFNRTQRYSIETGTIATTSWPQSAERIAARLAMSAFGGADESSFEVSRGARRLLPGNKIQLEGDPRVLLVTQTRPIIGTGRTRITAVVDAFSFGDFLSYVEPDDGVDTSLRQPVPDIRYTFYPLGNNAMGVLRTRGNDFVESAAVVLITGSDPVNLGDQGSVAGGTTAEAFTDGAGLDGSANGTPLGDSGLNEISFGPELNSDSDDVDGTIDLIGDDAAFLAGGQVLCIQNGNDREFFFVREIGPVTTDPEWEPNTEYGVGDIVVPRGTPTSFRYRCTQSAGEGRGGGGNGSSLSQEPEWPTTLGEEFDERADVVGSLRWRAIRFRFEPRGLIRARYSTQEFAFPAGSSWWVFQPNQITPLTDPRIADGSTLTIKTQPYTEGGAVELADVTAVTRALLPFTP